MSDIVLVAARRISCPRGWSRALASWSLFLVGVSAFTLVPAWAQAEDPAERQAAPVPELPELGSERVVVVDAATDAVLLAKNDRQVGGIASTTKIFVAMVVRQAGLQLDSATKMTRIDRDHARGGARTRLDIGHSFRNHDLLRAMLIASDNRAPTALGRAVGLSPRQLIRAMNRMAAKLGLKDTVFTDPSGLRGNESTARDMAVAFKKTLADSVLAEIVGTAASSAR
jgi:D-alanyl-D-alanine endopeptidase (penicillin-binding protein 7)